MNLAAFVAVGIGAALGAWSRWGLSVAFNHFLPALPLGTLAANLAGGFLIGAALEFFLQHATLPPEYRLFVITGFLGSLTTFSAFSLEAVMLLEDSRYGWAMALIGSHLIGSLAMTMLGLYMVRALSA
ncbi:MAG: fluoride efflux transporter CrcB [Betaproteobacteria bacterium]|jgi:CrcB protein|nr:fluoride efflux transporter CrcB [Betaproteobacteria bacterium]